MPRTVQTPGQGVVDSFAISTALDAPAVDFAALKKNGFSIAARDVKLQGQLPKGFEGDLLFTHVAGEQTLLDRERVKDTRGGRYDFKVHLLRGRNTFFFASSRDPEDMFRVDIFYRSWGREWVDSIVKALILVLVMKTFVVQAFFIPTESMQSTLLVGDYLLVDKITYLFRDPKPGEIVVFEYPVDPSKDFIKRCVAVAGDKIAHLNDRLLHNGKPLHEPYTQYIERDSHGRPIPEQTGPQRSFEEITIPPGKVFLMGDNRNNSQDSRYWGALPRWRIIGKAWGSYWPILRLGLIRHEFGKPLDK